MKYALILALCLSIPALAGDQDKPSGGLLAKRDKDGDGRLSLDEFGKDAEVFEMLDKDGDGFLTAAELPQRPRRKGKPDRDPERRAQMLAKMLENNDRDGDGQLSTAEWPEHARMKFEAVDANGDGFIDLTELTGAQGRFDKKKRDDKQRPAMDPEQVKRMAQGMMKRLDGNGDGQITPDEAEAKGQGRFDFAAADANKDGVVDVLEVTAAIQARGQRGPEAMMKRILQFDANGDGMVDRQEWKGPEEAFARLDVDQDGTLSKKELKQALKGRRGRWNNRFADAAFGRFDTDGDGKIAAAEWKAKPELFQRFDSNGDGFITRDEITPKGPRRGKRLDVRSGKDSVHFLAKYDANRDGQVTKQEFPHDQRFAEIDTDADGVLSEAEIKDAMDKIQREKSYGFLERFDLDGDGQVTRDEFTGAAATFERMDKNHDGVIDAADKPTPKRD